MSETTGDSRQSRFPLPSAFAFLIALSLGLLWMLYARTDPFSDFIDYFRLAEGLIDHHQFGYPRPTAGRLPGYPAFLAIPMLVSRSIVWLSLCNILLTALLAVIVFQLTSIVTSGNKKAATIAALLCAINPTFVFYSPVLASEHLFAVLLFSAVLVVLARPFKPIVNAAIAGLLAGATILTRGEAVFYVPVLILVLVDGQTSLRRRAILGLALVVACFVVVFPWYLRNLEQFGPGVGLSTKTGVNFYLGHNPTEYGRLPEDFFKGRSAVAAERDAFDQGLDYLRENPLRLFKDMANGTKELYVYDPWYALRASLIKRTRDGSKTLYIRKRVPTSTRAVAWSFYWLLLLLAIAGAVFCRKRMTHPSVLFGLLMMNWVCHAVVFFGKSRFRYSMEVVFCVLAGIALQSGYTALVRRRSAAGAARPATPRQEKRP